MKVFEYKLNKSYSTYLTAMSLVVIFIFIFNGMSLQRDSLLLTIIIFMIVSSWIFYMSFSSRKKRSFLEFKEKHLNFPGQVTGSGKDELIPLTSINSIEVLNGDLHHKKRPGFTGIEVFFERVENIQESVFLQKKYFEENEYETIIKELYAILNRKEDNLNPSNLIV